ncbi:eukaryotic aspartyl protease family protein [Artemisia annua]|uniref:Eukaryotic aspartyl protease family protein n=1 Tax=Artemisia annua TaxID=35608 RepID=A0A2U1LJN9_ARTAN|nr:eukaryotic aspartyl protease family protein [Artemisia annua]
MTHPSMFDTIFNFLLFISLFTIANHTHARQQPKPSISDSIVLGLTNTRTTIKLPKESSTLNLKVSSQSSQTFDMIEPLREIRDGYIISLNLGSPPQVIQVYMDTGSDLTWVPCGNLSFNCIDCDDYPNNSPMPKYSPLRSSTCTRDTCTSQFCVDVHSSENAYDPCNIAGCSLVTLIKGTCSRPCPSFVYTYGEGVVAGTLSRDTLRIHGSSDRDVTRDVTNFGFGCVGSTYREPIGIAGFGKGSLSLPSQLGFLQKGFSHCFLAFKFVNNPNVTSPLVIGDLAISSKENLQFTPMLKNPMYPNYYYIGLEGITLGIGSGSLIQVPTNLRDFDSSGNGGMLIDSGTTYTHLPQPFYTQLLSQLESVINHPRAKDVETRTGFDLCYRVPCINNLTDGMTIMDLDDHLLPAITFHFMNNVSLVLPQGNSFYVMGAPRNSTVVKCLLFQSMDDKDYGPAGVFGSFQQQNVEVVYDMEKERIGFQTMDCASSSALQQLHKS